MDIIKSSADISCLFENGRRIHTPSITLIVSKQCDRSKGLGGRVAFVAGKKQGNAVWRNRAKRRMRAVCHEIGGGVEGYDVIFLAKRNVNTMDFEKMRVSVANALCALKEAKE